MGKNPKNNKKNQIDEPRVNDQIRGYDLARVVYRARPDEKSDDDFTRVMGMREARNLAYNMGLDLVEINPNAEPPVLKLCDYSKYLYELKKQAKQQAKQGPDVKEISLSVNISRHDLETKANKAREFVEKGHKVKVNLLMKSRELQRREESKRSILEFILMLEDIAVPESMPKDEGNRCIVYLKKKK